MVKIFEEKESQEYEYNDYKIRYDTWNGVWVIDGLSREYKDKTFVDSEQAEDFIDTLPIGSKKVFSPFTTNDKRFVNQPVKKNKTNKNKETGSFPGTTTYKQIYTKYKDQNRVVYLLGTIDGKFAGKDRKGSYLCDFCDDNMQVFSDEYIAVSARKYWNVSFEVVEAKIKNGDLYVL